MNALDSKASIHIPIGIPNTVDTLKTFVEPEGCLSPGVATYGIYFWLWDRKANKLHAATMDGVACEWGLRDGTMIPWSRWKAGDITMTMEVCHVLMASPAGDVHVVGVRLLLENRSSIASDADVIVALRPLGPAGGPVNALAISEKRDALIVHGHAALVAEIAATDGGVLATDSISELALLGNIPDTSSAASETGDCSGVLRFPVTLGARKSRTLGFICPVLPGRIAVGHSWDGCGKPAQLDLAKPNIGTNGALQPDAGLDFYRKQRADALFRQADDYWSRYLGKFDVSLPDVRWREAMRAILGHVSMAMNEDAPDVTVVNYNVYSRDGIYTTNILQKTGRFDLAEKAIDYFLAHPFNGRAWPEADNPGQILWILGEHWQLGRDRAWLAKVYPSVAKLVSLIRYYRTTPGPHWVKADSLEWGDTLPPDTDEEKPAQKRQELKPGSCDGLHPEYTEAFDIAGIRVAAQMAEAFGRSDDAAAWRALAGDLFGNYGRKFEADLRKGYGNIAVLWPCRLYAVDAEPAHEQFKQYGAFGTQRWRYFPLATAHQGLYAGNRHSGHETIERHLDEPQMRGWHMFDEGGGSGTGGWAQIRTNWNASVAMPHGWAIAELWLLIRDSLVFEDGDKLVLFAGIPPTWFKADKPVELTNLPTHGGLVSLRYQATGQAAELTLKGSARPEGGFVLRLPPEFAPKVKVDGRTVSMATNGDVILPSGARRVEIKFAE